MPELGGDTPQDVLESPLAVMVRDRSFIATHGTGVAEPDGSYDQAA
jgi:hypothetical protein